jgi:hypothetical protein
MSVRNIGNILGANQLNAKIQNDLQEYQQLNYDSFIHEFIRIAVSYYHITLLQLLSMISLFSFYSAPSCQIKSLTLSSHAWFI